MYRAVKMTGFWYIFQMGNVGEFRLSENEEEVVNIDTFVVEGTLVMLSDDLNRLTEVIRILGDSYQLVEAG